MLYFPELEPWMLGLFRSPVVPPGLSAFECETTWSSSCRRAHPGLLASALPQALSVLAAVSAAPTSMDECFFFNSLVVGLP